MSWVSKHLGIRLDGHSLGNLARNIAPVAGTIIGGPLGLAAAGGLGALGNLGRGKNIGESLKAGLSSAGQAGIGQLAGGALGYHGGLGGIGKAATSVPTGGAGLESAVPSALPGAATDTVSHGGLALPSTPDLTTIAQKAVDPRSILQKAGDAGGGLLNFAEAHPNAASGALQGLGGIVGSSSENRLKNAEASRLEQQAGETAYDFQRRKARDAQLAPVWGALGDSLTTGGYSGISKNPYLAGA